MTDMLTGSATRMMLPVVVLMITAPWQVSLPIGILVIPLYVTVLILDDRAAQTKVMAMIPRGRELTDLFSDIEQQRRVRALVLFVMCSTVLVCVATQWSGLLTIQPLLLVLTLSFFAENMTNAILDMYHSTTTAADVRGAEGEVDEDEVTLLLSGEYLV